MAEDTAPFEQPFGESTCIDDAVAPWSRTPTGETGTWPGRAPAGRTTTWRKAQQVFCQGDEAKRYFEVIRGAIRCYVELADGRRQIIEFFFPGDMFGLSPTGRYLVTAEAVTNVTLRSHPAAEAYAATDDESSMRALLAATVDLLRAAHARMLTLGRMHAEERVATFLLQMDDRIGPGIDGSIELPMTRLDIADYLGLTIETVSRTFSELKQEGLIALPTYRHVILLNRVDLRNLAGDSV